MLSSSHEKIMKGLKNQMMEYSKMEDFETCQKIKSAKDVIIC